MHRGNILLHRKIVDWEWYTDANTMRLFIHLLLTANWEPKKWRGVLVNRGQTITSLSRLAEDLHLSVKQIRVSLTKLKRTSEVTSEGASSFTLITLTNYESYQDHEKIRASKRASERAIEGQSEGKQRATTKSLESLESLDILSKKTTVNYSESFDRFWKAYPSKTGKALAAKSFARAIKIISIEKMLEAVDKYKQGERVKKGFVCNPATWLNQERWSDEITDNAQQLRGDPPLIPFVL